MWTGGSQDLCSEVLQLRPWLHSFVTDEDPDPGLLVDILATFKKLVVENHKIGRLTKVYFFTAPFLKKVAALLAPPSDAEVIAAAQALLCRLLADRRVYRQRAEKEDDLLLQVRGPHDEH